MARLVNADLRVRVEPVFTMGAWYIQATIHVKPQDVEIAGMKTPDPKVQKKLLETTSDAWDWINSEVATLMS